MFKTVFDCLLQRKQSHNQESKYQCTPLPMDIWAAIVGFLSCEEYVDTVLVINVTFSRLPQNYPAHLPRTLCNWRTKGRLILFSPAIERRMIPQSSEHLLTLDVILTRATQAHLQQLKWTALRKLCIRLVEDSAALLSSTWTADHFPALTTLELEIVPNDGKLKKRLQSLLFSNRQQSMHDFWIHSLGFAPLQVLRICRVPSLVLSSGNVPDTAAFLSHMERLELTVSGQDSAFLRSMFSRGAPLLKRLTIRFEIRGRIDFADVFADTDDSGLLQLDEFRAVGVPRITCEYRNWNAIRCRRLILAMEHECDQRYCCFPIEDLREDVITDGVWIEYEADRLFSYSQNYADWMAQRSRVPCYMNGWKIPLKKVR